MNLATNARELPAAQAAGSVPKISIRSVGKTFHRPRSNDTVVALKNASLDIADNTFVSLVGPSGCGKTTLLRMINGLIKPDSGEVLVSGKRPVPGPSMGFVFQSFRLIPWATVQKNVAFTMEVSGTPKREARDRADRFLELVGLSKFRKAYPSELSGGMKQRVALARAFANQPEILLMDEPFASIDAQTRELMQIELMSLWARQEGVVVFVTHSVDEAVLLADQIVLMGPRPGRIVEVIPVDLPRPRWGYDIRANPEFIRLRSHLWAAIRDMVVTDPGSDFYGRETASQTAA
ncbi:MAG: ABC transporter ATP-binding protein [Bauldia sp.]|nr:ABC transporter ATP-binding protein [Bauldia sp.]